MLVRELDSTLGLPFLDAIPRNSPSMCKAAEPTAEEAEGLALRFPFTCSLLFRWQAPAVESTAKNVAG